jgi:electron transfer flavoprotein beta subunit
MKILVPIKRVIDYSVKIRVKADGSGVETTNVKMSMNPFDEIALEEALRLKEKNIASENIASEVIVVSIGGEATSETLKSALAMGADRAIHLLLEQNIQSLQAAKLLKIVVDEEKPNLIITGKQAIDDDAGQTGQMLAALLKIPQASFASKIDIENNYAVVVREVDGGHQTIKISLPAVITTDLRLNEPRYISLPNIMKARSKPIDKKIVSEMELDITSKINILKIEEPQKRAGGIKVKSVDELLDKLRNVARVL